MTRKTLDSKMTSLYNTSPINSKTNIESQKENLNFIPLVSLNENFIKKRKKEQIFHKSDRIIKEEMIKMVEKEESPFNDK